MDEDYDYRDWLKRNRTMFLAVLMQPVVGMIIAIALIIWIAPVKMTLYIGIIAVIMLQYLLLVRWISGKMDKLISSEERTPSKRKSAIES